ncbi:Hypothetical protein MHC_05110 [Mycoplasma haemocanis str. Illinois]|uniref:Uncharacterized protein n=1 Tax=Mycoplasma haemocanis (strain Illinois) TaxID=1111676 RepID=H6N8A6_MYCHN|nr:Hypothetical protein MHC_05110 [Mycoplasma haemocanis str. Illinois]
MFENEDIPNDKRRELRDLEVVSFKEASVNDVISGGPKLKEWCKATLEKIRL